MRRMREFMYQATPWASWSLTLAAFALLFVSNPDPRTQMEIRQWGLICLALAMGMNANRNSM